MNERSFYYIQTMHTLSKGKNSRANILRAAHDLFLQQGYHGTSMRQIAEGAGTALGAIYNHFPGKETIFREIFLENHPFQEILPALLSAEGEDPETLVRNMANHFVGAFEKHPDYLNLMFIELVEFKSEHAVELYQQMLPQVAGLLEHVQSAGQEKLRDIPPLIMLRVFIGLFFSYHLMDQILQPVTTMPATLREKAIDMFIDIFLHGVLREGK